MSKTKTQLEAENDALRAVLAAIGEGMPPLPADPEKMRLYAMECAARLSGATIAARAIADCRADYLAAYAQEETVQLRRRWGRPLHYEPERPGPGDCACGHPGTDHIHGAPSPCTQCGCTGFSDAGPDGTPVIAAADPAPPAAAACMCGHPGRAHTYTGKQPCTKCACTAFAAMPEPAGSAK